MASVKDDRKVTRNKLFRSHFEDFLDRTETSRINARNRRDYRDLKQWTDEEIEVIRDRGQAPVVFDQFGKKIDAFCGLEIVRRTDPKALPRTKKHEKSADVITEALRFVADNTHFDEIASEVFEEKIVEGYGAVIIEYNPDKDMIEAKQVHWDRFYYDPHSRKKDYADATYMGMSIWMDRSKAEKRWNTRLIDNVDTTSPDGIDFDDRPRNTGPRVWGDAHRDRVRINQEYFLEDGVWHEVWYSGDVILEKPKPSPYLDEDDNPVCPIEAQCDYVDRDNNRYGYSERLRWPQDEINHRRSKALDMLSSVSVIMERGALGDVAREEVLQELKKAQSVIEILPNSNFQLDRNIEMGQSQISFYQDALQQMDSIGINPELSGSTDSAISGRAFIARQQSGLSETGRIFAAHSNWKKRVYSQMWMRIRQFWSDEKWLRVTDDENAIKWAGINVPVRRIDQVIEQQLGKPPEELDPKMLMQMGIEDIDAFIEQAIAQNPLLGEQVDVKNDVNRLEMDIIIEDVPDTASLQQEQFEILAQLAGQAVNPNMFKALIELSTMPHKDKIISMLEGDVEAQQAQQQQLGELQSAQIQGDLQEQNSRTMKNMADVALKEAQAKDELASAIERVNDTALNVGNLQ